MKNATHTRYFFVFLVSVSAGCSSQETSAFRPSIHRDPTATPPPEDVFTAPLDASEAPDGSAPVDVVTAPPDQGPPPSACVSGRRWTRGDDGNRAMNPGQACLSCHRRRAGDEEDAPRQLAGTAYEADGQEDNCYGFAGNRSTGAGGAYVEVVDGAGTQIRFAINESGNFLHDDEHGSVLRFPLRSAAVVGPTGVRNEMGFGPPHGDCNACHTRTGTTTVSGGDPAPGRILVLR
jgi:hypothetical protein